MSAVDSVGSVHTKAHCAHSNLELTWKFDPKTIHGALKESFKSRSTYGFVMSPEIPLPYPRIMPDDDKYVRFFITAPEFGDSIGSVYCKTNIYEDKCVNLMSISYKGTKSLGESARPQRTNSLAILEALPSDNKLVLYDNSGREKADSDKIRWWICKSFMSMDWNGLWTNKTLTFTIRIRSHKNNGLQRDRQYSIDTRNLFLSNRFSDVTVKCGEMEYPAHKLVLTEKSVVMLRMFESDMSESREGYFKIEHESPECVRQLLRFMYTGHISPNASDLQGILALAHMYDIPGLVKLCEKKLADETTESNFEEIYRIAEKYKSPKLMDTCFQVVKRKRSLFETVEGFEKIVSECPEIVKRLCMDNCEKGPKCNSERNITSEPSESSINIST